MSDVRVRIDRIAVEIADERRAEQAEETVRKALALLGARLAQAPLGLGARAPELAVTMLDLGPVDPDWLGGPGAADLLAQRLYERLLPAGSDTAGADGAGHGR